MHTIEFESHDIATIFILSHSFQIIGFVKHIVDEIMSFDKGLYLVCFSCLISTVLFKIFRQISQTTILALALTRHIITFFIHTACQFQIQCFRILLFQTQTIIFDACITTCQNRIIITLISESAHYLPLFNSYIFYLLFRKLLISNQLNHLFIVLIIIIILS